MRIIILVNNFYKYYYLLFYKIITRNSPIAVTVDGIVTDVTPDPKKIFDPGPIRDKPEVNTIFERDVQVENELSPEKKKSFLI